MKCFKIVALIIAFVSTLACQPILLSGISAVTVTLGKGHNPKKGPLRVLQVMGDPEEILKGTTTNGQLDRKLFTDGQQVYLLAGVYFQEKSEYDPAAKRNTKEENAPSDAPEKVPDLRLQVAVKGDGEIRFTNKDLDMDITLKPSAKEENSWIGIDSNDKSEHNTARLVHFSHNANMISLTFIGTDAVDGKGLSVIYISLVPPQAKAVDTDKPFYYSSGKGVRVSWPNKSIPLNICGEFDENEEKLTHVAASAWNKALVDRAQIAVKKAKTYPPFSDLNSQCVYVIKNLLYEPNPKYENYGATISIENPQTSDRLDSDILILDQEFKKNGPADELLHAFYWIYTMVHEMGHFLGLDHQFDGTPSIMSYEFKSLGLTQYDVEAVQHLYEPRKK